MPLSFSPWHVVLEDRTELLDFFRGVQAEAEPAAGLLKYLGLVACRKVSKGLRGQEDLAADDGLGGLGLGLGRLWRAKWTVFLSSSTMPSLHSSVRELFEGVLGMLEGRVKRRRLAVCWIVDPAVQQMRHWHTTPLFAFER